MPRKSRQYLVIGGNSRIGKELCGQLEDDAIAKTKESLDITELSQTKEVLKLLKPDVVINAAGYMDWVSAERDDRYCWRVNTEAVDNLAKCCAFLKLPLLHVSDARVFGQDRTRKKPYTESDCVGPVNAYAQSKVAAEQAILRAGLEDNLKYWIVRTSFIYERPWRVSQDTPYRIMSSDAKSPPVRALKDVFCSPTYAPHLAKALIHIMDNRKNIESGIYHIANKGAASVHQFGLELVRYSRRAFTLSATDSTEVCQQNGISKDKWPRFTPLDSSKFEKECGYELPTWQEGLQEYVQEWGK